MKKTILISAVCLLASLVGASAMPTTKGWEQVKSEYSELKSIVKDTEIEILTAPSLVVVSSSKPVKIQIFTILGRLVSSETLPAGTSQLSIQAHGVYIVKVGELTCKIAI
ncbi:MAG: T9SS type A sorting domain-containing protein [Bacteroides sp.]|nr:T9SS type A sorting domain-containing protein [Bacteroides sp.]